MSRAAEQAPLYKSKLRSTRASATASAAEYNSAIQNASYGTSAQASAAEYNSAIQNAQGQWLRCISMLDDYTRYRLLRLLTEHPEMSQRELSTALGLSLGKTNYCVRALIERGWVKAQNFRNSDNKLSYAYVLTPMGVGAKIRATADFLRRKQAEFVRLEQEIAELRNEVDSLSRPAPEAAQPSVRA